MIAWQPALIQTCDDFSAMPFKLGQLSQLVKYTSFLSGNKIRLVLSNSYGKEDLYFDKVVVSKDAKFHVKHQVTYLKRPQIIVPKGQKIQTDPLNLEIKAGEVLYIWLTSSKEQTYADVASSYATTLLNASYGRKVDYLPKLSSNSNRRKSWFSLDGILVWTKANPKILEFGGDSLAEMGFVSQAFGALLLKAYPNQATYVNTAISGSRLLRDCPTDSPLLATYGLSLLKRQQNKMRADISIFFCGGNDLLLPNYSKQAQKQVVSAAELLAGFDKLVTACPNKVIFSTILPAPKIVPAAEKIRQAVNAELVSWPQVFDGASLVADNNNQLLPAYQLGDGLHLNQIGGEFLARKLWDFLNANSLL